MEVRSKNCFICGKEGKYKCPKCSIHNCSLYCFKSHKESGKCEESISHLPEGPEVTNDRKPGRINVFTTIDTVPPEKLELLNSESIKNLLNNKHLRDFLEEVNSASHPWNAMRLAMMEPIFLEFANECLKIVEPEE